MAFNLPLLGTLFPARAHALREMNAEDKHSLARVQLNNALNLVNQTNNFDKIANLDISDQKEPFITMPNGVKMFVKTDGSLEQAQQLVKTLAILSPPKAEISVEENTHGRPLIS